MCGEIIIANTSLIVSVKEFRKSVYAYTVTTKTFWLRFLNHAVLYN